MNEIYAIVATAAGTFFTYYAKKKFDAIRNKDSDKEDLQGKRLANIDELMAIWQKLTDEQMERMSALSKIDMEIFARKIDLLTLKLEECQSQLKKYMEAKG